jgi:hypothetical protein
MLKLDSIRVNVTAERDGEYISIPDWEGVKLGVRSLEYPAYKIALDQLVQRYARRFKGKPVPPDVRDADVGAIACRTHSVRLGRYRPAVFRRIRERLSYRSCPAANSQASCLGGGQVPKSKPNSRKTP